MRLIDFGGTAGGAVALLPEFDFRPFFVLLDRGDDAGEAAGEVSGEAGMAIRASYMPEAKEKHK